MNILRPLSQETGAWEDPDLEGRAGFKLLNTGMALFPAFLEV